MMALKFIILVEKVANKSKLKEEGKKYKSCDNLHLQGTEAEYSNEGDKKETNKIKEDKYGCKKNKESKRDDKKEIYKRYEDLSSDWEEIKEAKYYIKLKEKLERRNLLKGFNPKKIIIKEDMSLMMKKNMKKKVKKKKNQWMKI